MRKLIAFHDDTLDKLKQIGRSPMATLQQLADEALADLLNKHGVAGDLKGRPVRERKALGSAGEEENTIGTTAEIQLMTTDPDPFEQGERAARKHIPAEANPYQDGSDEHALWAAGHEKAAGEAEAEQSEGT